jgi:hypothetical protein
MAHGYKVAVGVLRAADWLEPAAAIVGLGRIVALYYIYYASTLYRNR